MRFTQARHAEDFYWIISLIQDLYKINTKTNSIERVAYFQKFALFTEMLFKAMISSFAISCFIFLLYPIYIYMFTGQLIPIAPLYLPGVDVNSIIGYTITSCYHIALFVVAIIGFSSLEFFVAIIIISSLIFAKLISIDLMQINKDLNDEETESIMIKGRLLNVFLMHQKMNE